ncbi:unnamed protein product [Caretta caretta]
MAVFCLSTNLPQTNSVNYLFIFTISLFFFNSLASPFPTPHSGKMEWAVVESAWQPPLKIPLLALVLPTSQEDRHWINVLTDKSQGCCVRQHACCMEVPLE